MTRFTALAAASVAAGWFFVARSADAQSVDASFTVQDWNLPSPTVLPGLAVSAAPQYSSATGSYTYPDGETGTFKGGVANYQDNSEPYDSFAQLQSAEDSAGPGSLTVNLNGQTSTYSFKIDLSGIDPASLPQVQITDPAENSDTSNMPVFQWTDSNLVGLSVEIEDVTTGTGTGQSVPVTQTSWSPSAPLAPGDYYFGINTSSNYLYVPVDSTLVSGPDVGVDGTATFMDEVSRQVEFTVVPEPSCLALMMLAPAAVWRRRRC